MEIENARDDVASIDVIPKIITHRFDKRGNFRQKRDVGNISQSFFINDRGGICTADEIVYISQIVIYSPLNVINKSHIQVTLTDVEGRKESIKQSDISYDEINASKLSDKISTPDAYITEFNFKINALVKSFEIKVPNKIDGKKVLFPIHHLKVFGYSFPRIKEITKQFIFVKNKVDEIDNEANAATKQRNDAQLEKNEIDDKIKLLVKERDELESQSTDIKEMLSALVSEIEDLKNIKKDSEKDLRSIREESSEINNNNQKLLQSNSDLNKEISAMERELRNLEGNRNIISDEYHDYVEEGRRQSVSYYWLSGSSLFIVACCAWFLIYNSIQYLSHDPKTLGDTISLIMQRSPFVIGALSIAGAGLTFAKFIFDKIVGIDKKRLALTKLLILAKEISFSANKDAIVDDEIMYQERLKLKIEMLKSHLVKDIGEEGLQSYQDKISQKIDDIRNEKQSPVENSKDTDLEE